MMIGKQLIQIIRHFLNNEPITIDLDWLYVWTLAKRHNLGQLIYLYMNELPVEKRPESNLQKSISDHFASLILQHVNQIRAIQSIHSLLEAQHCYHMFIKGSVTKLRYRDPIYRSMTDIDFLYRESQHKLVKSTLLKHGFTDYKQGRKNDTYYLKHHVCVEAHRQLVPSKSSFFPYCSKVWKRARVKEGNSYYYELAIEDEFVFNIIHLAIHFLEGGAGVRFIMDVYVYNHLSMDFEYLKAELARIDLLEFYQNVSDLAENWFGNGPSTNKTEKLSRFVLENSVFGTTTNSSALAVRSGRLKYLFGMCLPSYNEMKSLYPWVDGRIVLLPIAWGIRGYKALKHKRLGLQKQVSTATTGDKNHAKELYEFYKTCGLRSNLDGQKAK